MARITLYEGVRADERKTILMFANSFDRSGPALHVVALLTLCAELSAMNIGVAVGAFVTDLRKHGIRVALCARNALVHAAEREVGSTVIELRQITYRLPCAERVAVLTGDLQRPVRTSSGIGRGPLGLRSGGRRIRSRCCGGKQK